MGEKGRGIIVTFVLSTFLMLAVLSPVCQSGNEGEEIAGTPPGWSDDINLSNDQIYRDIIPIIAVNGTNIHTVWLHNYNRVYYSKSINNGAIWSPPISLYNSTPNVEYPFIRVINNLIHVVWSSAYRIFYRNSTDNGDNWNPTKFISNGSSLASYSRMFVNGDNVHVSWRDVQDGSDGEVYYRRSLNGGITFDNGEGVDQDRRITFSPSYVSKPLIAGFQNNISLTWMDERNGDFEIYWMISRDNGNTWEDGLGNVGQDRRLSFTGVTDYALGAYGSNIYVVWDKYVWPGPIYTMYFCNSSDNGLTWSPVKTLSGPSPTIFGPALDIYKNNVTIVWSDRRDDGTNGQIYLKNSTDGGITWNPDCRLTYNLSIESAGPDVCVFNGAIHLVRADRFPSNDREVFYKRSPDFPPDPTFSIPLSEGWNLISTPLAPRDVSIGKVLENITGKWDVVKYYDTLDKADPWKTYRPGSSVNDLVDIDETMGFWIYINQPNVTLTVSGPISASTTIPLYAGWNLVGYPTQITETVANALWGTGADRVEVFDPMNPYLIKEVGATYVMKPGEGYWVHVPADTLWVINW